MQRVNTWRETDIDCHCFGLHVFESFCLALFLCFAISLSPPQCFLTVSNKCTFACHTKLAHVVNFCNTCFETEDMFFTSLLEHHSVSQSSQTHQSSPHRIRDKCPHAHPQSRNHRTRVTTKTLGSLHRLPHAPRHGHLAGAPKRRRR